MLNRKFEYNDISSYQIGTFIDAYKLLELLERKNFSLSKNEILNFIEYDINLNKRSIDKILERTNERFKNIFGFNKTEYYYDRKIRKYILSLESTTKLLPYKTLYDYLQVMIIIKQINKDEVNLSKVLEFNDEYKSQDLSLIISITNAILSNKSIKFKHFNHFSGLWGSHVVEPWFIKQYNNRFFLGCYRLKKDNEKNEGYRTFTVNQITKNSLSILDNEIDLIRKENEFLKLRYDIFESCIGVRIHSEKNPSELCTKGDILIETNYKTGKDWVNIPLHKNQQHIETKENGNHIFLFPNFFFNDEFKKILLANASSVKVLKPNSVILELKEELKANYSLY